MKNLFIVTSAIMNDYGKYTRSERLNQIVGTIQSINKYDPGSDIMILDSSFTPVPESDKRLLAILAGEFLEIPETDRVLGLYRDMFKGPDTSKESMMSIKTNCECTALIAVMKYLEEHPNNYNRVFKLTGRYRLWDAHVAINYDLMKGKFCCASAVEWDRTIFPTRLWSFDYQLLPEMRKFTVDLFNYINERDDGQINILEEGFHRILHRNNIPIQTLPIIGCEGNMFDGHWLKE